MVFEGVFYVECKLVVIRIENGIYIVDDNVYLFNIDILIKDVGSNEDLFFKSFELLELRDFIKLFSGLDNVI